MFLQNLGVVGKPERLTTALDAHVSTAVTPDGETVLANQTIIATSGFDLMTLSLATREVRPLLNTPSSERNADLSPDGRFMVFQSDESGRDEIYVRPFPNGNDGV